MKKCLMQNHDSNQRIMKVEIQQINQSSDDSPVEIQSRRYTGQDFRLDPPCPAAIVRWTGSVRPRRGPGHEGCWGPWLRRHCRRSRRRAVAAGPWVRRRWGPAPTVLPVLPGVRCRRSPGPADHPGSSGRRRRRWGRAAAVHRRHCRSPDREARRPAVVAARIDLHLLLLRRILTGLKNNRENIITKNMTFMERNQIFGERNIYRLVRVTNH